MKETLRQSAIKLYLIAPLALFTLTDLFARAGGAGGGRSSGGGSGYSGGSFSSSGSIGGSSGSGGPSLFLIMLVVLGLLLLSIYVLIMITVFIQKRKRENRFVNVLPTPEGEQHEKTHLDEFQIENPDFDESFFMGKVLIAFNEIQDAWSRKDLTKVRRYITDGVWQRFNTQFIMMNQLEQNNLLSSITVKKNRIILCEVDGDFDVIHVLITARLNDLFVCDRDHSFDSGGWETFTEIWSFIRCKGTSISDIYSENSCPGCGGDIGTVLGDTAICPYCSVLINSGEYDWVLSEITQSDDWARRRVLNDSQKLGKKRADLMLLCKNVSAQGIEDRVSNALMQILCAKVLLNPDRIRRFVSDSLYSKLSEEIVSCNYLYNRLYTNDVTVIGMEEIGTRYRVFVSVKYSSQKLSEDARLKLRKCDRTVTTTHEIFCVEREIDAGVAKGNLYMNSCSYCGAAVEESDQSNCPYCDALYNACDREWIVTDIMNPIEYSAQRKKWSSAISVKDLDVTMALRDYSMINSMIVIASDGVIDELEQKLIDQLGKTLKYSVEQREKLLALAQSNRLSLSMPEDQSSRKKVFDIMVNAANADGKLADEEREILQFVKETYIDM